jgi:hypothetical protein
VTEDQLAERDRRWRHLEVENKDLKARLERLEAISVERLTLAKQASHKKRKKD